MKIVAISDTHGMQGRLGAVPQCDVLVHTGDITMHGNTSELLSISKWLSRQPADIILVVAGNHDRCFQVESDLAQEAITSQDASRIIYLCDKPFSVDDINFYGSPWQPTFNNWYFNLPRNGPALEDYWNQIPENTHVLLTHSPPHGILDKNLQGMPCGCEKLLARVNLLHLKTHIFGHIHDGYGSIQLNDTLFVNASSADEYYNIVNPPVVVYV